MKIKTSAVCPCDPVFSDFECPSTWINPTDGADIDTHSFPGIQYVSWTNTSQETLQPACPPVFMYMVEGGGLVSPCGMSPAGGWRLFHPSCHVSWKVDLKKKKKRLLFHFKKIIACTCKRPTVNPRETLLHWAGFNRHAASRRVGLQRDRLFTVWYRLSNNSHKEIICLIYMNYKKQQ